MIKNFSILKLIRETHLLKWILILESFLHPKITCPKHFCLIHMMEVIVLGFFCLKAFVPQKTKKRNMISNQEDQIETSEPNQNEG